MKAKIRKMRNFYLGITLFTALFSVIYEVFSHGVYSVFMLGAAAIPFLGIVLPYTVWLKRQSADAERESDEPSLAGEMYQSAVLTFLLGSVFAGVLEIYGTTNRLLNVYWIVGANLVLLSCLLWIYRILKK